VERGHSSCRTEVRKATVHCREQVWGKEATAETGGEPNHHKKGPQKPSHHRKESPGPNHHSK